MIETRCYNGTQHDAFVTPGDDGYEEGHIDVEQVRPEWHNEMYGYCQRCFTAMRWDVELQQIVDWPDGNVVPHCGHCGSAIGEGQHYLSDVVIFLDTYMGPEWTPVREVTSEPVFDAPLCSPICLMYEMLDNERLQDVFKR